MDKSGTFPKTWMLIVLAITTAFVGILFALSISGFMQNREAQQYNQPQVVLDLLEALTEKGADYSEVLSKFVVPAQVTTDTRADGIGEVRDQLSFSYVLSPAVQDIAGYKIVQSREGYVEFATLTEGGEANYPLIVFAYRLTDDGSAITDYSLGRLQPFSRRHPEYGEEWQ